MNRLAHVQKQFKGLGELYLLISWMGFSKDEAGNDIMGVVTIPEGGFGSDLTIKEPEVHAKYQELKRRYDDWEEKSARKGHSIIAEFYRWICDYADGGR